MWAYYESAGAPGNAENVQKVLSSERVQGTYSKKKDHLEGGGETRLAPSKMSTNLCTSTLRDSNMGKEGRGRLVCENEEG